MVPPLTPYGLPFLKIGGLQLSYPLLSQEEVKLRTSNLEDTFIWPIRKKPIKNFGENGAWAYPETAQFLGGTPIISGTGKATDFKFGGYIYRDNPNKSLLTISENRERGRIRGVPNFLGTPYYLRNG